MLKSPKGEKRPANVSGAAIPVSRIAKGVEADGNLGDAPNRAKDGEAGADAPAKSTTSARRKEINKAAAAPRWEG